MKASIISVGNELLSGQCVDTNRAWIGQHLFEAGIEVVSGYTVGDDVKIISNAMNEAILNADIIIITGGLGPTDDDITRPAVANFIGDGLEYHEELFEQVKSFFKKRSYQMPERNKSQAYIPVGSQPLTNKVGTAPGFIWKSDNNVIAAMPGVPSEMKKMFVEQVLPELSQMKSDNCVLVKRLKCFGIGESRLADILGDLMQRENNPLVNCTVNQAVITLHIVSTASDRSSAEEKAAEVEKLIKDKIGVYLYGSGDDGLEDEVARLLTEQNKTIAIAESCTGGMIAKMLTDLPGASQFFEYGWVTYSNSAKNIEIGVPVEMIEEFGAVSQEVAVKMSQGARANACSDIGLAVTGIAGPGGGSEQKPVGLVYISATDGQNCIVEKCIFPPERGVCRLRTAQKALDMVRCGFLLKK